MEPALAAAGEIGNTTRGREGFVGGVWVPVPEDTAPLPELSAGMPTLVKPVFTPEGVEPPVVPAAPPDLGELPEMVPVADAAVFPEAEPPPEAETLPVVVAFPEVAAFPDIDPLVEDAALPVAELPLEVAVLPDVELPP